MKLILFLISSQLVLLINANIITSGNGVSVAGHLNRDGLSSTVIKTQQLNDEEQRRNLVQSDLASSFADETLDNERKNDDTHFRLYYKQNSPGRSLSHELEHRYFKNPNSARQRYQENVPYQAKLNSFISLNNLDQNDKMSSYINQNYGLLHYQSNPDLDVSKGHKNPDQQKIYRNNVIKMLLMNIAQNQKQSNQFQSEPSNKDNGLQYKIVHLKFKIEPQQGIVGQGVVETDNGAGSIINSKHFNLMPRELPDLIRRLLYAAQIQQQPFANKNNQGVSLKKKRSEDEVSLDETTLEKRSSLEDKPMKKSFETNEEDDKMNDNEFQESLKSLQRRDDRDDMMDTTSLSDNDNSDRLLRNDEDSSLDDESQL